MLKGSGGEGCCVVSSWGEANQTRTAESGGISEEWGELITGGNAQSGPVKAISNEMFLRGKHAKV